MQPTHGGSHVFIIEGNSNSEQQQKTVDKVILDDLRCRFKIEQPFRRLAPSILHARSLIRLSDDGEDVRFLRAIEDAQGINIWFFDYSPLEDSKWLASSKWLFIFDLDSTLIQMEVIDELARLAGLEAEIKKITREAMEGLIDFKDAFIRRVGLLKGLDASLAWKDLKERLVYTRGADQLMPIVSKSLGGNALLAIVSGGFMPMAEHVKEQLGFDLAFANNVDLIISGEDNQLRFSGETKGLIINAEAKRDILLELSAKYDIPHDQIVAVGDGANDIQMLSAAGIGISFCGKPKVRQAARYRLDNPDLSIIATVLGEIIISASS